MSSADMSQTAPSPKPISKLLVANRGEIARRVITSAHAMGIACVAVFSDPDSCFPHVTEADEAVHLEGGAPRDTYLNAERILQAALDTGADAIHPGYGFLSEDPRFARAVEDAGLTFVGPPSAVIEAMGSKLAAKATMQRAGVPVLPTIETTGLDPRSIMEVAAGLSWPLLVKASAGGGGRGMRVVESPDGLMEAIESASREAAAAFGDGTVFIEPYLVDPRHVEVQVIGDAHGTVVHLFERECSIQRRHQKILEECPSPALGDETRQRLLDAAVLAARTIGYVNAGTVEFVLSADGTFAFLEVNTRLQVEHPVTEAVTGLDLVRLQLLVAEGFPLPEEALAPRPRGHAIEVRLYAEDPTRSWQPSAGRLHRFFLPGKPFALPGPGTPGLRVDSGAREGNDVSTYYDPMLAKLTAHAESREEAARVLADGLARARIHGVSTNRDLLISILRHPEFLAGRTDTGFLTRHDPASLGARSTSPWEARLHALAGALGAQAERRSSATVLVGIPSGWRNNPNGCQKAAYETDAGRVEVEYRLGRHGELLEARVGGEEMTGLSLVSCEPRQVLMEAGGVRRLFEVHQVGNRVYVDSLGSSSVMEEIERFPAPRSKLVAGSLVAPLPGTVVKVAVSEGDTVEAGDLIATIEAMKMEHAVIAPEPGTVTEVRAKPGDQVDPGQVLAVVS